MSFDDDDLPLEAPDVDTGGAFDDEDDATEGERALGRLFAADGPEDLDEGMFAGPLYWPSIPAADIEQELEDLRAWVQELLDRFEHLDNSVIPPCWWRHNGHVEALQALRDHERMSYAESSPGQAAASWHREFQFVEMRLREWTSWSGCGQDHKTPMQIVRSVDEDAWGAHIAEQRRRRESRELDA